MTPDTFGSPAYSLASPLVATNGSGFLTLWTMAVGDVQYVYGSAADSNGRLISSASFLVGPTTRLQELFPRDGNYVALLSTSYPQTSLLAVTLSPTGGILASVAVPSPFYVYAAAFNGTNFLLTGASSEGGKTVWMATVVGIDGQVVRAPFRLEDFTYLVLGTVASDFIVATSDLAGEASVLRLSADGARLAKTVVDTALYGQPLTFASLADTIMFAWRSGPNQHEISVVSMNGAGVVTGRSTLQNPPPPGPPGYENSGWYKLSLTPVGPSFRLLATSAGGSQAMRLSTDAHLLNGPVTTNAGNSAAALGNVVYNADVVYSGTYLIASPLVVRAIRVDAEGIVPGAMQSIATNLRLQALPRAATDGVNHLLSWADMTRETVRHPIIRLAADGRSLDSSQTDLATVARSDRLPGFVIFPPHGQYDYGPGWTEPQSVAFGRSVYLVVWPEGATVMGRLISRNGSVMGNAFVIGTGSRTATLSDQAIAWDGSKFRVLWQGDAGTRSGLVSTSAGSFAGTGAPKLVWDGRRFVVAVMRPGYVGAGCHCYISTGIIIYRIDSDGTLVNSLAPYSLTGLNGDIYSWHLASNGANSLLVVDELPGYARTTNYYRTSSAVIHADGPQVLLDAPEVLFEWMAGTTSDITWDGSSYVISWMYAMPASGPVVAMGRSAHGERPQVVRAVLTAGAAGMTVTANPDGAMIVVSESTSAGEIPRLRTHTEPELELLPRPPAAPHIVSVTPLKGLVSRGGNPAPGVVTWTMDHADDASGFVIEALYPQNSPSVVSRVTAGPNDRSSTFSTACAVRVRAFNAGGFSEPSEAIAVPSTRVRAAHH